MKRCCRLIRNFRQALFERRAAEDAKGAEGWKPTEKRKRIVRTALKAYARLTTSADRGAVRDLNQ